MVIIKIVSLILHYFIWHHRCLQCLCKSCLGLNWQQTVASTGWLFFVVVVTNSGCFNALNCFHNCNTGINWHFNLLSGCWSLVSCSFCCFLFFNITLQWQNKINRCLLYWKKFGFSGSWDKRNNLEIFFIVLWQPVIWWLVHLNHETVCQCDMLLFTVLYSFSYGYQGSTVVRLKSHLIASAYHV